MSVVHYGRPERIGLRGPRLDARTVVVLGAVLALVASAVLGVAVTAQPLAAAAGVAGIALAAIGLRRPALFLLALLFSRALLDSTSTISFGGVNPAGMLATSLVGLALLLPFSARRALLPAASWAMGCIAAVTAGGAVLAVLSFGGTVGVDPIAEAVRIASLVALYVLAANVLGSERNVRLTVVVAGLSGVIPAIWGLLELISGPAKDSEGLARISGPFNGPNPLGFYLAVTALVLLGTPSQWLSMRLRLIALVPMLGALVPTYSRVGYVTFLVGLLLLQGRRRPGLVVALVSFLIAAVVLIPNVRDRVLPQPNLRTGQADYESYSWRTQNWVGLMDKWSKDPAVGYGTETAVVVNPRRPADTLNDPDGGYQAHNLVVRVLVEGGLVLFAAYVWCTFALVQLTRRLRRERGPLQPIVRLLTVLWIILLIVGLGTDDPVGNTSTMFVLLMLTGAVEGTHRRHRVAATRRRLPARTVVRGRPA